MPHALLRTTRHKRRLYWLYGLDQLHGQKDALSAHGRNWLFVCCSVVLFLFFSYVCFFMYKRTTAPWAGQESEKQPKFKDKLIHEARRAVKNITTALAAVDRFFFHNAPKVANEELSMKYHVWWGLSITLPHAIVPANQSVPGRPHVHEGHLELALRLLCSPDINFYADFRQTQCRYIRNRH